MTEKTLVISGKITVMTKEVKLHTRNQKNHVSSLILNLMSHRLKYYFHRPFPHLLNQEHGWHYLIFSVVIFAIFINLYLWLMLSTWDEQHKWMILPGFGMCYALCYYIVSVSMRYYVPAFSNPEAWTVGKECFLLLMFIPFMLTLSWIYMYVAVPTEDLKLIDTSSFLKFNFINSGIMMVTLTTFTGMKFKTPTTQPTRKAGENSLNLSKSGTFEVKKKKYKSDEVIYVLSDRNNIYIYLWVKQALVEIKEVFPISQFEQLVLEFPQLKRCHLSCIVNLDKVLSADNADHQLELTVTGTTKKVTVSNYYRKEITELLMLRSVYCK